MDRVLDGTKCPKGCLKNKKIRIFWEWERSAEMLRKRAYDRE